MGLLDGILKLVQKVVDAVLAEITKQMNKVQNEVVNELTKMISAGFDDAWRGEDADQFKEKIKNIAMPHTSSIVDIITKVAGGLKQAGDINPGADQKTNQLVSDIVSEFSKI